MEAKRTDRLEETDRDYLVNVLNEVLRGFPVDFNTQLQSSRQNLLSLDDKLRGSVMPILSPHEARILIEAAHLCEASLDTEFQTRLGLEKDAAQVIVSRLERRAASSESKPKQSAAS